MTSRSWTKLRPLGSPLALTSCWSWVNAALSRPLCSVRKPGLDPCPWWLEAMDFRPLSACSTAAHRGTKTACQDTSQEIRRRAIPRPAFPWSRHRGTHFRLDFGVVRLRSLSDGSASITSFRFFAPVLLLRVAAEDPDSSPEGSRLRFGEDGGDGSAGSSRFGRVPRSCRAYTRGRPASDQTTPSIACMR